jgi:hypothetical protein
MSAEQEFVTSSDPGFFLWSPILLEPLIDPPHLRVVPCSGQGSLVEQDLIRLLLLLLIMAFFPSPDL